MAAGLGYKQLTNCSSDNKMIKIIVTLKKITINETLIVTSRTTVVERQQLTTTRRRNDDSTRVVVIRDVNILITSLVLH